MSTATAPDEGDPEGPAPGCASTTGATASERAAAQAVRELSEPERLDGSQGPE